MIKLIQTKGNGFCPPLVLMEKSGPNTFKTAETILSVLGTEGCSASMSFSDTLRNSHNI